MYRRHLLTLDCFNAGLIRKFTTPTINQIIDKALRRCAVGILTESPLLILVFSMLMVSRGPLRSTGRIRRGRWLPVAFADLAIDGGGMPRLNRIRAAVGSVVRSTIRRNAREFLKATENCRDTQQRVLHDLLKLNDGSRFQREHGLHHVRTVDDFRGRLSIADFEYFRPYIEDVKQGDHGALLGASNRLLMFTLSSGTTAESKFIPITRRFLHDYRRGWQIWGIRALDKHRQINGQTILQLSSNFDQFRTAGNTPCGNISGLVAAMQKRIVRSMFSVPVVVSQISDTTAKLYTALRLSMADPEIGMITTANPSTLIQMAKLGNDSKQDLIRDIADGRLSSKIDVKFVTKFVITNEPKLQQGLPNWSPKLLKHRLLRTLDT